MFWIWAIIVGLLVGLVARFLLPGRDPVGFVGTILVGVAGVLIGTWLWDELLPRNDNQGFAIFAGVVVTMTLLWVIRRVSYGRRRTVL